MSDEIYELIVEDACGREFDGNRFCESRGCEGGFEVD